MSRFKVLKKIDSIHEYTNGTSLKGYLKTGIKFTDLYQVLGEPTFRPEDSGDGKVQYEWVVKYKDDYFTIYDWKTYDERYTLEEYDRWHVGGKTYSGHFEELIENLVKRTSYA